MTLTATRCANGHLYYPDHERCPTCGAAEKDSVELGERKGTVVTWTRSMATPPGVRQPNELAIVEFTVEDQTVRVVGQVDGSVETGDTVEPVYVAELRDPDAGIRDPDSQDWDGYRFEPV